MHFEHQCDRMNNKCVGVRQLYNISSKMASSEYTFVVHNVEMFGISKLTFYVATDECHLM